MKKEIINNLLEGEPIKGVQLPDGRWVTEKFAQQIEKRKHGGSRPGSGRKAVEKKRVQMMATVAVETRDTIKDYCKDKKTRLGRVLDTMVEQGIFKV